MKYIGDLLQIAVMDKDVTSDDKVGETQVKVQAMIINGGIDEWFEIQYKGKLAGKVHIVSKYAGEGTTE